MTLMTYTNFAISHLHVKCWFPFSDRLQNMAMRNNICVFPILVLDLARLDELV